MLGVLNNPKPGWLPGKGLQLQCPGGTLSANEVDDKIERIDTTNATRNVCMRAPAREKVRVAGIRTFSSVATIAIPGITVAAQRWIYTSFP
jgi:hypothetical protein